MTTICRILAVAAVTAAVFATTAPAGATDARQAIRLCEVNPNCKFNVDDDGGVTLVVDDKIVSCPRKGACSCVDCGKPARTASGKPVKGSLVGILARSGKADDVKAGDRKPFAPIGSKPITSAKPPTKNPAPKIVNTTTGKGARR